MVRKKTYQEKLEEIAKEYERKLRPEERKAERLRWENWESLGREAIAIARNGLRRHGRGMVLPGGYDAESIASQAIADLMSGKVRGPVAPTRQRLVKKLEVLIQGKIRLLTMLKETSVTRSEWDSDGGSALSQVRDETADVWQAVSAHEAEAARLQLKAAMKRSLDGEPDLAALLECRWKGMTDPAEMARELGLSEVEVVRARKRLDRRLATVSKRRMDRENHR